MVIINCCCYTCRLSRSVAVVASPSSSPASGPGLALPTLPFVPPLLFFSFLVLALVPFFLPCFYSLRHVIYSLIFSSAPSLSAHRFLSSSILSFLSLARPFPCLSFKCFLSWSSISALSGVERSIGVFFILLSLLDNCLAIPFLPP